MTKRRQTFQTSQEMIFILWRVLLKLFGLKITVNYFFSPYKKANVKIKSINRDFTCIVMETKLGIFNRNFFGVHFGGSLYAMCDPIYTLMLNHHFGKYCMIWDKKGTIEFIKPAINKVTAHFLLANEKIEEIENTLEKKKKLEILFETNILNTNEEKVAKMSQLVYIRKINSKSNA